MGMHETKLGREQLACNSILKMTCGELDLLALIMLSNTLSIVKEKSVIKKKGA